MKKDVKRLTLQQLFEFINNHMFGKGIHTYPDKDIDNQKLYEACVELEKMGRLERQINDKCHVYFTVSNVPMSNYLYRDEVPVSRLLLESTNKDELEKFIANELQTALKDMLIKMVEEIENEILYGNVDGTIPIGILNAKERK